MKSYSTYQFAVFRIVLGLYLIVHFLMLIPYAGEVWSASGMLPDPSANLTHGFFPNILNYLDSSIGVALYVALLALLSIFFTLGFQRPIVSILLWYGWASLFDRNNLISNPGIPYIGWLLLCCAVIPKGEALAITKGDTDKKWEMPIILFVGAWVLMAVGYTISGFDKFASPSWRDGSAIFHLLENPLARDSWIRDLFVQTPMSIIKLKTWAVLFIEMAFLPLALIKFTRKWIWLAMIAMHLGILLVVDFADLTIGMLMMHWFTFDPSWFKAKPEKSGVVYFDGVCGMCNSFINFLIGEDQAQSLQFSPLQGETAKQELETSFLSDIKTVVFKEDGKIYTKSDAIIRAMSSMGGMYRLLHVFRIVPKFLRDNIYEFIAERRYKWFAKKAECRIPTPEERMKFLP